MGSNETGQGSLGSFAREGLGAKALNCVPARPQPGEKVALIQSGCDVSIGSVLFARRAEDNHRRAEKVNELRVIPLGEDVSLREVVLKIYAKHRTCSDEDAQPGEKLRIEVAYTPAQASSYSFSSMGKMPEYLEEASWFSVDQYWSC